MALAMKFWCPLMVQVTAVPSPAGLKLSVEALVPSKGLVKSTLMSTS